MKSVSNQIASSVDITDLVHTRKVNNVTNNLIISSTTSKPPYFVNPDSGCNGTMIPTADISTLLHVSPALTPVKVSNPDGSTMRSTHTGNLPIPGLPDTATAAMALDTLQHPLLCVGQLCDNGCTVTFTQPSVVVEKDSRRILTGDRDPATGLYRIDIMNQPVVPTNNRFSALSATDISYDSDTESVSSNAPTVVSSPVSIPTAPVLEANESIYVNKSVAQLVEHYHALLFCPAQSTFEDAISRGYLSMFPQLTTRTAHRNPPNSLHTAHGHLDRVRQGLRSTKSRHLRLPATDVSETITPDSGILHVPASFGDIPPLVYVRQFSPGTLYSDATGNFPVNSHSGNKAVMIFYIEGANAIISVPLASTSADATIAAYATVIDLCKRSNIVPSFARLDNQTSLQLENYLQSQSINHQYVSPSNHRANKAERAIRTWKNHFIAGLSSADPSFDFALWDHLLLQCDLSLNLMRSAACDPSISAWQQLHGAYDFAAHPLHRPGCKVVSWVAPDARGPFSAHGDDGFYLGPALDHYRCYKIWIPGTRAIRTTDTVSWHPFNPLLSNAIAPHDELLDAISYLTSALTRYVDTPPVERSTVPLAPDDSVRTVLITLRDILRPPSTPPSTSLQRVPEDTPLSPAAVPSDTPPVVLAQRVPVTTNEYNAERIMNHRGAGAKAKFLVHWSGYDHAADTWEPFDNVRGCIAFHEYAVTWPKLFPLDPLDPSPVPAVTPATLNSRTRRTRIRAAHAVSTPLVSPSATPSPLYRANAARIAQEMHTALESVPTISEPPIHLSAAAWAHLAGIPVTIPSQALAATFHPVTGDKLTWASAMTGPDKALWEAAAINEFDKLFTTFDTMHPIWYKDIPKDRTPSYFNPAMKVKIGPTGEEIRRIRGTFGGDRSDFTGDTAAHTASMSTIKIHLNEVVSDPTAHYMTADAVDYYLWARLDRPEYMSIDVKYIPTDIFERYQLAQYVYNGRVYVQVDGCLYGLPQAGLLAEKKMKGILLAAGFVECPNAPCLFRHATRKISFTLVVDDFGICWRKKEDAEYLMTTLEAHYKMKTDWTGTSYLGYKIEDKGTGDERTLTLSMPKYVPAMLKRFDYSVTTNVYQPEKFTPQPYHSAASQLVPAADDSPLLSEGAKTRVQQIVGSVLYYARALDSTLLCACNRLASQRAKATDKTLAAAHHLLAYCATYPDVRLVFKPSDMILRMDSDASYNSETGARSRASYVAWLGKANDPTFVNGFIDVVSAIIPTVVASASEAEYAALFITGKGGLPLRNTLDDMDCIQPPTIITTDNKTAAGIATDSCKSKRSKSIDMRYHWIRDRVSLKDFDITWHPGVESMADFNSKVQPVAMVLKMRHFFVQDNGPAFSTSRARRSTVRKDTIVH